MKMMEKNGVFFFKRLYVRKLICDKRKEKKKEKRGSKTVEKLSEKVKQKLIPHNKHNICVLYTV